MFLSRQRWRFSFGAPSHHPNGPVHLFSFFPAQVEFKCSRLCPPAQNAVDSSCFQAPSKLVSQGASSAKGIGQGLRRNTSSQQVWLDPTKRVVSLPSSHAQSDKSPSSVAHLAAVGFRTWPQLRVWVAKGWDGRCRQPAGGGDLGYDHSFRGGGRLRVRRRRTFIRCCFRTSDIGCLFLLVKVLLLG